MMWPQSLPPTHPMQNVNDTEERIDPLTSCLKESELRPELERIVMKSLLDNSPLALLLLATDGFSRYSRKWGPSFAQDLLKFISSTLRLSFEQTACAVFRHQDDGFAVIFPGAASKAAEQSAAHVVKTMRHRPFLLRGHLFKITMSGGIASLPADAGTAAELLARARKALTVAQVANRGGLMQYRWITRKLIMDGILLATVIWLIIVGLVRYFAAPAPPDSTGASPGIPPSISAPSEPVFRIQAPLPDIVTLKSGGTVEGTIIRRNGNTTEILPDLDSGKGSITVRNTEIQSLRRHRTGRPSAPASTAP